MSMEFPAVGRGDLVKIADDPTDRLEVPVVGEPDEAVVGSDVGRKGELAAAEGAEVALAKFRPPTSHQVHVTRRFSFHFRHIDGIIGAFVAAQAVPKLGIGFEVSPFLF